ncbi:amidohydrolase [Flagellimonas sp. HMM57]|uniref:amidohydrolase n=1 Tax=unclassified Flagellimonas TaxID=2644544 RepID=UPI0013D5657C|nr:MULTISPECIES: amidohydrolase [unclassified Flagellimonas]UII74446.1 amidohydrolase [Flagellimonas sp. HMM57]
MASELKIALIQSQLHWENPVANRAMFSKKIATIPKDTELIVLPEMFTTGFTMNPQNIDSAEAAKTIAWMQQIAQEKSAAITGSIVFTEKDKNFNRLFFCFPDGELAVYDKKHTFTLAGEDKVYEAGITKLLVSYKGFKIQPMICYDLRFPVWARNTEDYDVLIYVANWPKPRIDAWDALLKARAIENMSYCIGVNRIGLDGLGYEYSGHSAVYDVLGHRTAYSEKEEITYANLDKKHIKSMREKLRFLEDRDDFNLV